MVLLTKQLLLDILQNYAQQHLTRLNLTSRQLDHVDADAWDLFKTDDENSPNELILAYNSFRNTNALNFTRSLVCLNKLDLTGNYLQNIRPNVFAQLVNLTELSLSSNDVCSIGSNDFHGMDNLIKLDLSANQLDLVDFLVFHPLKKLKRLEVKSNQIRRVEFTEWPFGSLFTRLFICSARSFECHRPFELLKKLESLTHLNINCNRLEWVNSLTFAGLYNIHVLGLSFNLLKSIGSATFGNLCHLRVLDLSNNRLETLDERTFENLTSLRELWLSENELVNLGSGLFDALASLELLALHGNRLESIEASVFERLIDRIQLTTLYDNKCDEFFSFVRPDYLTSLTEIEPENSIDEEHYSYVRACLDLKPYVADISQFIGQFLDLRNLFS